MKYCKHLNCLEIFGISIYFEAPKVRNFFTFNKAKIISLEFKYNKHHCYFFPQIVNGIGSRYMNGKGRYLNRKIDYLIFREYFFLCIYLKIKYKCL